MSIQSMNRREALILGSAAGATVAFPFGAMAAQPRRGGTLVVAGLAGPRHLNGAVQSGTATGLPSTQLFASPLRFDDKWQPQPYLAERWELAADGRSLTLHLRPGMRFHDDKPITSADVAFSVMAIKANHPFITMMAPVERVDTPDPLTAVIRMKTPHPAIVLAMSPGLCPILPKHIYDDGQDLKSHPRNSKDVVGSGPFRLVEFVPGQRVVMERFDHYFLPGKPYLDKVVIQIITDPSSAGLSIERGDIQMLPLFGQPTELKRLAGNKSLLILDKGYEGFGGVTWLAFNLTRKPMSDLRVRKAIATAIDKNFIAKALQGGFAQVLDGPLEASSPFATNELVRYPFDLKKAAAMLDAAGYPAGASGERFKVVMDYLPGADEWSKNGAEYLRAQLKKVGITVEIRSSADFAAWAQRMANHDFDMSMDGTFNWGDPTIGVDRAYLSTNIKPVVWSNTQSYSNPKVDHLLGDAAKEVDSAKRRADYAQFQKIVTDELPVEFLTTQPFRTVLSNKVLGAPTTIWGPLSPYDEVSFK